jgi:glycosyltransferase involved in cell wall biosynthesis
MVNIATDRIIYIISSTESLLTKRGNRHPVLAEKLTSKGHKVVYLTTDFYHAEKRKFTETEISWAMANSTYSVHFFSSFSYGGNISLSRLMGNIRVATSMMFFLLKRVRKQDIVLVSSRPPEFVVVANIIRVLRRNRFFIDVRDVWPDGLPLKKRLTHRLFALYCKILYSISASKCAQSVYTAPGFLGWVKKYCPESNPVFVPIGYDSERWEESTNVQIDDIQDEIRLVYVGDLAKTMNIDPLMKAVAGRDSISLTFIGGGELLKDIKAEVAKMNISNIHFKGFIAKERVVEEMREMHISVIPMKVKYVMPNKMFDAMACYRPMLVFGQNDAADFVENNDIGWKLPFDEKTAEEFVANLKRDEIVKKSKNISKIRAKFSKEFLYDEYVRLLSN